MGESLVQRGLNQVVFFSVMLPRLVLLHRYGISLVPLFPKQWCVGMMRRLLMQANRLLAQVQQIRLANSYL
ncbi:hypothetical protein AL013_05750 [Mariprofundus ferrooxydans]|uniref:Uncharacterized protein n=1 Tax=Mariprofundus ferrooxydans PV-1 TaxID=314345 RepID=Q0EW82_9PROT|nr:hypothetical protein SPV1_03088 [Mariprofundus ferrooxydans PV-1]KON47976.1 hypothetical protein AL013_05750 [Mariprofundus ferrooxydans]